MLVNTPQFTGLWIPRHICFHPALDAVRMVLISQIHALDPTGEGCTASNGYFGGFLKIKPNTVSFHLSALAQEGFLTIEYADPLTHAGRKIYLNTSVFTPSETRTPPSNYRTPPSKKSNPPFEKIETESKDLNNTLSQEGEQPENASPTPPAADPLDISTAADKVEAWTEQNLATFNNWHQVRLLTPPADIGGRRVKILEFLGYYRSEKGKEHQVYTDPLQFFINRYPKYLGMSKGFAAGRSTTPPPAAASNRRGDVNAFYQ